MYVYNEADAETDSKLSIQGTTYEPGFASARQALGDLSNLTVLDYGSGAGRTARLLLGFGASKVVGVDHNITMVERARAENIDGAEFLHIDNEVPLPDATVDAALSAHVLVEVSSRATMRQLFAEVFRVLKPGGLFVLITNNERAIGMNYLSFQYERHDELVSGQRIPILIKGDKPFMIDDYFWLERDYIEELEGAGFDVRDTDHPTATGDGWLDETNVAPHVVITATKP